MINNEAGFHKLIGMQGIILIAQIITVGEGTDNCGKILMAWNPDLVIQFLEVFENSDDVDIIINSKLQKFMSGLWESDKVFRCRTDPFHVIPPGCLVVQVKDPKNEIPKKCPLLLTNLGLTVDTISPDSTPTKWQDNYAQLHDQGNESAEIVRKNLLEMFPAMEPNGDRSEDKITLAAKCYNLGIDRYDKSKLDLGSLIRNPKEHPLVIQMNMDLSTAKVEFFIPEIFSRCGFECIEVLRKTHKTK